MTKANLGESYLAERGLTKETIRAHGIEIDELPNAKKIKERLGFSLAGKGVNEIIWIPLYDKEGKIKSWIARPLPRIFGVPKFLCPTGSDGTPYIPSGVYELKHDKSLIITEGPIKALACKQAGVAAIGLNGVWGASVQNVTGLYVMRADLQAAIEWCARKVYLGFDLDCESNPKVRQALIRLFFVLSAQGAQVFKLDWKALSK